MVLIRDETSGRTQLGLDMVDAGLQRARTEMLGHAGRYRDALDALKVELGLAPEAPVVIDPLILAAFGEVYEAAEGWVDAPGRDFNRLAQIVNQSPKLDDIAIGDRSLIGEMTKGNFQNEGLLRAAVRAAASRRDEGEVPALRMRREVRRIQETWLDYEIEKRRFVLAIRLSDRAREDFFSPPNPATFAATERVAVAALADAHLRLVNSEDRVVAAWVAYQVQRLALLRDLGTLPAEDWPGFFGALTARKANPNPR